MKSVKSTLSGMVLVNLVVSQLFVTSVACAGQIYHCKNADGSMSFQSTPCEDKTLKVESTKEQKTRSDSPAEKKKSEHGAESKKTKEKSKKKSVALTKAQLLGTWTDFPDEPKVRGLWVFSSGSLRVTNYMGVSYTHKYQLEGNILRIHHDPIPGFKQKPWVQEIEIKDFDGKRITFGEGGPAGTDYIYKLK
jgi:hypothetical protein